MVIIQPSSGKVVVVNNTARGTWFLPRGRKDIGETLEQCALREAYEEVRLLVIVSYFLFKRGWRAIPPSSPFPRKEKTQIYVIGGYLSV